MEKFFDTDEFQDSIWTEDAPDFIGELVEYGREVMEEDPAQDCQDWINVMIRRYPTEVVDAFGTDPQEVFHALTDLWEEHFSDFREYGAK